MRKQQSLPRDNPQTVIGGTKLGALDATVKHLTRVALGQEAAAIPDEQLDHHIAQLILRDAERSQSLYKQHGASALLQTPPDRLLATNKRFLSNVIRATDAHNAALLWKEREQSQRLLDEMDSKRQQSQDFTNHSHSSSDDGQLRSRHPTHPQKEPSLRISITNSPKRTEIPASLLNSNIHAAGKPLASIDHSSKSSTPKVRGRGATGPRSLDKIFDPSYNPNLDLDNFDEESSIWYVKHLEALQESVNAEQKAAKKSTNKRDGKKRSRSKKAKKERHHTSDDSESDGHKNSSEIDSDHSDHDELDDSKGLSTKSHKKPKKDKRKTKRHKRRRHTSDSDRDVESKKSDEVPAPKPRSSLPLTCPW
eukprot:jgi/Hompol1/1183/HPOL_005525-RA